MRLFHDKAGYAAVERVITEKIGAPFHIIDVAAARGDSMHPTARLIGEKFSVFVKAGTHAHSLEQFRTEAWELAYLHEKTGIRTPEVYDVVQENDTSLLILEAIPDVSPETDRDWAVLGQGLAKLHQATDTLCGLEKDTYLGIFHQKNEKKSTWAEFYGECRLRDTMQMAVDAGKMTPADCDMVEKLIDRLPALCPPQEHFSLLHGDPWPGNLMFDGKELVLIDPAIYYGNREIDLTTVDFFFPVSHAFFDAYHEANPIDPGFAERSDLWKINQWLGHVTLFGDRFLGKLMDAVKKYL